MLCCTILTQTNARSGLSMRTEAGHSQYGNDNLNKGNNDMQRTGLAYLTRLLILDITSTVSWGRESDFVGSAKYPSCGIVVGYMST